MKTPTLSPAPAASDVASALGRPATDLPGPAAAEQNIAPSRLYAFLVLMLVLSGLDQTILSTALPSIVADLHGRDLASWVFSAYLMASTAVIPLYGKLADRWGVRPLLLVATGLFALGSLACAAAGSMPMLVAARALQGLGGGGLMTLTMLAVAALYPLAERPRRMGLLGAAYGIATLIGPLAGGLLLEGASWHWAFLINVPGALLAWGVFARGHFGTPQTPRHRLDVAGAVLLAAGLVALLLATRGAGVGEGGVDSATLVSAPIAAAAALVLFALWLMVEKRAEDPVITLSLYRVPAFAATAGLSALSGVALFAAVVFLPIYLQQGMGMGVLRSALHTMPLMLGITAAAQISGRAMRAGRSLRRVSAVAAGCIAVGFGLLAVILWKAPLHDLALAAAVLPVGVGLGLMFPLVTAVAQRSTPPRHMGMATAMPVMLRALGGALGVASLGELLRQHMAQATAAGLHSGAQATQALAGGTAQICAWAAVAGLMAALISRALPQRFAAVPVPAAPQG